MSLIKIQLYNKMIEKCGHNRIHHKKYLIKQINNHRLKDDKLNTLNNKELFKLWVKLELIK